MIVECRKELLNIDKCPRILHCISRDRAMGMGFARQVTSYIQRNPMGVWHTLDAAPDVLFWFAETKMIANLITKENYFEKPTIADLALLLCQFEELSRANPLSFGGIWDCPRIGCGLDRLEWEEVKGIMEAVDIRFRVWGVF